MKLNCSWFSLRIGVAGEYCNVIIMEGKLSSLRKQAKFAEICNKNAAELRVVAGEYSDLRSLTNNLIV